jgi:hypothetical protein
MSPTGRNVYYDSILSDFATRTFDTEQMGFVADRLTGLVSVQKQSANYYVFDPSGFMKVYDDLRAPRTAANKVSFNVSTDNYFADNRALAGEIALEDLANQDVGIRLRENTTAAIVTGLRRAQEVRAMNLSQIWGRICLFFVGNPGAAGMDSINYVTRFRWRNPELPLPYRGPDGSELSFAVQRTQYDGAGQAHVEVLETGYYQSEKVTGPALSYLLRTNSG